MRIETSRQCGEDRLSSLIQRMLLELVNWKIIAWGKSGGISPISDSSASFRVGASLRRDHHPFCEENDFGIPETHALI